MIVILRRFAQMVVILAALSFVLFGLLSAMPGDPVDMLITSNPRIKPEDVVRLKKLRGLDKPWYVQYVRWIWGYNDPRRPATLGDLPAATLQLDLEGKAQLSFDLLPYLHDPDFHHDESAFLTTVRAVDPSAGEVLEPLASEGATLDRLGEVLYNHSPATHETVSERLREKAASSIRIEGLFGAATEGATLQATFEHAGIHSLWFAAVDTDGYESVGRLTVFVAPPSPALSSDEPGALDEQAQQLAGGTEQPEPSEPSETDLIAAARAAAVSTGQGAFLVDDIPAQVVDDPETFRVDLENFVLGLPDDSPAPRFTLAEGSPGVIEDGVYRHVFKGPGQTAVRFIAESGGQQAPGAFAVEHGPIPDAGAFNRGFVFAFTGDREALGFSNTYKRPVWEILAGTQAVCGDYQVGPGETCDDGNLQGGDGCSAVCQDEALGFWQKLDARAAGWLMSSGRIFNTIQLMLPAILLSLLIAIPIGVLSAYRQYTWIDYVSNFFAFVGISLPAFWFGIMVLALFAEKLQILPAGGIQTPGLQGGFFEVLQDRVTHTIMPAVVLSIVYTGRWLRYMRASMLEILPLDFIRTARAKGLSEKVVILKHALRNALIPVVTVLALSIPALFGGALLTEQVFAWPGVGRLQFESVMNNDYYVAIVVFLVSSMLLMLGNLLADILYVIVDPRIRKS